MTSSVKKCAFFTLFLYLILESLALAQVDTAWVRRYDGPGNGIDQASALAVDTNGNVYVTGYSWSGPESHHAYATIKYDPTGNTVWVRRYNGLGNGFDEAKDLAVDTDGNVYVTGHSADSNGYSSNYVTIKYAPNGDTLWVGRSNGFWNDFDITGAMVVDDDGNVYVTGYIGVVGNDFDYATIKYAPGGDTLWTARYDGQPNDDHEQATALALDGLGNVCVTGLSGSFGASFDYATIKYASNNGDTLWVKRYDGPGNGFDWPTAIKADASGNVYVTGYSESGTSFDYATIKYAANGDTLWVRRYNGPGNWNDYAYDLALDAGGNVYVTGQSSGGATNYDIATIKYASNGDSLWVRRYNGYDVFNTEDGAFAMVVDSSGNVYVAGFASGQVGFVNYVTIKYNSNGDSLWASLYNGPGNSDDTAHAIAVDGSGNVYVTGLSRGSGSDYDYATIKYAQTVCSAKPGDANASSTHNLADVVAAANYVFMKPGCSPVPLCWLSNLLCRGDWNGDGSVGLPDVVRGANFVFSKPGGPWNPLPSGVCCVPVP